MMRSLSARLALQLSGPTDLVFSIAPALGATIEDERIRFTVDGSERPFAELIGAHGARLHHLEGGSGELVAEYSARVIGAITPPPGDPTDPITYLRPSRYCESDLLTPTARAEFSGLSGHELLAAVTEWVAAHLRYRSGSSLPTDGATQTLLTRTGVCRDFAHVTIAFLRAMDMPARLVSAYAPGLTPMDFHAVVEAFVDGEWFTVDPTRLAPRQSLVRIATGRDAADTAWLTSGWTDVRFQSMQLTVTTDALPTDSGRELVRLG